MKRKVLIIEDDDIMRVTLEDSMLAQGYAASAHARGSDGVRFFKEDEFSLVITDVRLPDMTGIDVLRKIKEMNGTAPVIVMTAFGTIKDLPSSQEEQSNSGNSRRRTSGCGRTFPNIHVI
jgi:DNA-binding NtrC family response regulator